MSHYLTAVSLGFVSGLLLGAVGVAIKTFRKSLKQCLIIAD